MNQLPWTKTVPLIALGYRAGSGKDTVADYLVAKHGFVKFAFAGALKRAAKDLCGFTESQVNGSLEEKEAIDPRWGFSPRTALQVIGTEVVRNLDPSFWVKVLDARLRSFVAADAHQAYRTDQTSEVASDDRIGGIVISDLRFRNEMNAVRDWGGANVEVMRPSAYRREDGHASETSLKDVPFGYQLINNSTLEDLYTNVDELLHVIKAERGLP